MENMNVIIKNYLRKESAKQIILDEIAIAEKEAKKRKESAIADNVKSDVKTA